MLKEQLLKESQEIEVNVELNNIFESLDLAEQEKANFKDVFEIAVKKHAVELAESHIAEIGEKAQELVESEVEIKSQEIESKLKETAQTFFKHLANEWLEENKVAIDRGIKADLFESMFGGLKALFVEHNVELPAESVDVVAELEEALQEAELETANMFKSLTEHKNELQDLKRSTAISEAVAELTESQKEKVKNLVEDIEYNKDFGNKLNAIVEMAKASKTTQEKPLEESTINTTEDGLNFVVEEQTTTQPKKESTINSYVNAALKL